MRKGITIVAAAVIALAIAAPTASAYTHAQQDALLNSLKAKLNCLTKTPVTKFGDPAGSDWGYVWDNVDADNTISGTFERPQSISRSDRRTPTRGSSR